MANDLSFKARTPLKRQPADASEMGVNRFDNLPNVSPANRTKQFVSLNISDFY